MDVELSSELLELIMLLELLEGTLLELSSEMGTGTGYATEMPYVHARQSSMLLELSLGGWAPLFMGCASSVHAAQMNEESANTHLPQ
jgi:hypothetical protein